MTLTEAWGELGVEPGADAETVRRAYLRLIKTRKPESDPVGFQRAREAYEIARAGGEIESLAAASERRHAPAFGGAPATPGAPAPPPGGPSDGGDAKNDIVFEGFRSAWNSVPASADQRQRLEIAREAVAVLPNDPRAHWLLVSTLSRLGPDNALADALRAGWRAGYPEFLEALLVRLPGRATREEIDAGFASQSPAVRLAAAIAVVNWDGPRGAALVVELCRTAMAAPLDARRDHVSELPVPRMLEVILALHGAGALDAAAEAQGALRACLADSGLELAIAQGPLGGVWTLSEEIGNLPRGFPSPLRSAFAYATRAGDLTSAYIDTCRAIERDRSEVSQWATEVATSAPNVSGVMRTALAHTRAEKANRASIPLGWLGWVAIPMFLSMARLCTSPSTPSYTAPSVSVSERAYVPTPSPYTGLEPVVPGSGLAIAVEMTAQAAADLCGADGPRHGQLVCADVEALLEALRTRQCTEIPMLMRPINRALRSHMKDALEARLFSRVALARWQLCGTKEKPETDAAEAEGTATE